MRPILRLKDSIAAPTIPKPRYNVVALDTGEDVSADLAPEHRTAVPRKGHIPIAEALVACVRDVPREPVATRMLRLALAVIDLAPELPPGFVTLALRQYEAVAEDPEKREAEELRRALTGTVMNARLARFRRMVEGALGDCGGAKGKRLNPAGGQIRRG
jgi:hypothetical protein